MTGFIRWLTRENRAIPIGTAFVLLVLLALIVTPLLTSELAIESHTHIRNYVDPLDEAQGDLSDHLARMQSNFLQYVFTGESAYLTAYKQEKQEFQDAISKTLEIAPGLGPQAVEQANDIEKVSLQWLESNEAIIQLRQQGHIEEAQAAIAIGTGAGLFDALSQHSTALHDQVVSVRTNDRDSIDQILSLQRFVIAMLGGLGILAAVTVAFLARRTARLYYELQTEREHVAALAEGERRRADELDAIIENVADGIMIIDQNDQIVRMNRVGREIWQLPPREARTINLGDLALLDIRYPNGQLFRPEEWPVSLVLRGEPFSGVEAVYNRPDGKTFYLRIAGSAVRDEAGRIILGIFVFNDVTQIRELERQREEFISVVAHDLRGAVAIIQGYSELMVRPETGQNLSPSVVKSLEKISHETRRLARMISDLLDISRIEARRLSLQKRPVNLVELTQAVVARAEEMLKGHSVTIGVKHSIPIFTADPDRLEQILINLLSNAGKYSHPNTPITIDVESVENEVMISVTNKGPGIGQEDIPSLFTRFRRARAAEAGEIPGLGLGLYITKGLVEAHGGRIWVESKVGHYTTFHVTLPLDQVK